MRKVALLVTLSSLILCVARADQFQLRTAAPGTFNISYAKVDLMRGDKLVFSGRTDKLGRITITGLSIGTYLGQLHDSQNVGKSASFSIDRGRTLKIVELQ